MGRRSRAQPAPEQHCLRRSGLGPLRAPRRQHRGLLRAVFHRVGNVLREEPVASALPGLLLRLRHGARHQVSENRNRPSRAVGCAELEVTDRERVLRQKLRAFLPNRAGEIRSRDPTILRRNSNHFTCPFQVIIKATNLSNISYNTSNEIVEFGPAFNREFLLEILDLQNKIKGECLMISWRGQYLW